MDEENLLNITLVIWFVITDNGSSSPKSIPDFFGFLPSLSGLFLGKYIQA